MSTKAPQVAVKKREHLGSRANKRLRDQNLIPGVVYGHKEPVVPVILPKVEVVRHLKHGTHLFDLDIEGKSEKVLVKEVQYDHLGIEVLHVDFARVSLDEKVEVTIPLELKGEPKGAADGGVLTQIIAELHVECLVTDIPDVIRVSISEMKLNEVLHIKDIKLPHGVTAKHDADQIVASIKAIVESAEDAAAAAEPEIIGKKKEDGEGEAAAPAKK